MVDLPEGSSRSCGCPSCRNDCLVRSSFWKFLASSVRRSRFLGFRGRVSIFISLWICGCSFLSVNYDYTYLINQEQRLSCSGEIYLYHGKYQYAMPYITQYHIPYFPAHHLIA